MSAKHSNRAARSANASPEWYTPAWLMARIEAFYAGDLYDPCPASYGQIQENGLAASWRGRRVYCNPPYGRDISPWIRKAMTEPCRECILLIPAYTETRWFAPLYDHTLLFIAGRVRFDFPDGRKIGHGNQAPHPSVMVYRGRRYKQFAEAFADLGPVLRVYQRRRHAPAQPALTDCEVSA